MISEVGEGLPFSLKWIVLDLLRHRNETACVVASAVPAVAAACEADYCYCCHSGAYSGAAVSLGLKMRTPVTWMMGYGWEISNLV